MEVLDLKDVESKSVALTRREKILRWAAIIREHREPLRLFHNLEHWHAPQLTMELSQYGHSAFSLAAEDSVFKAAGLHGSSVKAATEFFDLSRNDLHSFACDCGGLISNTQMAERLTRMAGPEPGASRAGRIVNGITRFW